MEPPHASTIQVEPNEEWVLAEVPLGDDELPSSVAVENPCKETADEGMPPSIEPTECCSDDSSTESRMSSDDIVDGDKGDVEDDSKEQHSTEDAAVPVVHTDNDDENKASRKWFLKAKSILEDNDEEEPTTEPPYCNPAMAELLADPTDNESTKKEPWSWRKAGVAVAGGGLVGIGAVLVPMPVPLGVLTMAADMGVLGTEFPKAQEALDSTRDQLAKFAEADGGTANEEEIVDTKPAPTEKQDAKETTKEPTKAKFHQVAARTLRKQASSIKESVFQPLAGKTVAVYDQLKATTEKNQQKDDNIISDSPLLQTKETGRSATETPPTEPVTVNDSTVSLSS